MNGAKVSFIRAKLAHPLNTGLKYGLFGSHDSECTQLPGIL